MKLPPIVWSWLIALPAAGYAYFGLFRQVVPTWAPRNAGGEDESAANLMVTGPAARALGLGFVLVVPLAFASHVLGAIGLAALLGVAWLLAK